MYIVPVIICALLIASENNIYLNSLTVEIFRIVSL